MHLFSDNRQEFRARAEFPAECGRVRVYACVCVRVRVRVCVSLLFLALRQMPWCLLCLALLQAPPQTRASRRHGNRSSLA